MVSKFPGANELIMIPTGIPEHTHQICQVHSKQGPPEELSTTDQWSVKTLVAITGTTRLVVYL